MKQGQLRQITVHCREDAADAASELLQRVLGESASTAVDEDTRRTVVTAYLPGNRSLHRTERESLKDGLRLIKSCRLGTCRMTVRTIRQEDWAESWKRHFKPMLIDGRLLVRPSWSRRKPRGRQVEIVLDPGLAFGTGQHPTTGFCLHQIVAFQETRKDPSFLDIGTGSGILAIAAAKLGYAPVEAFDFDKVCIQVATANAIRNQVQDQLHLLRRDLLQTPERPRRQFDLVCANLIFDLLVDQRHRILARVAPAGRLVLAGILKTQFARVRKAFAEAGMRLLEQRVENEWQSGAFERCSK